jgi:hypothetical protein
LCHFTLEILRFSTPSPQGCFGAKAMPSGEAHREGNQRPERCSWEDTSEGLGAWGRRAHEGM